jgi:phosphoribosylanthranilate isomerase
VKIKVCGITCFEDALGAVELGAWAVGFVFHPESPRQVSPQKAAEIIGALPASVVKVGVFVDAPLEKLQAIQKATGITSVQLHGSEDARYAQGVSLPVIKAVRPRTERDLSSLKEFTNVSAWLVDAWDPVLPGGTGKLASWELARRAKVFGPVILAGGLTAENVAQAIDAVQPLALDVSSGLESTPGKKDPLKMKAFFDAIRAKEGMV